MSLSPVNLEVVLPLMSEGDMENSSGANYRGRFPDHNDGSRSSFVFFGKGIYIKSLASL